MKSTFVARIAALVLAASAVPLMQGAEPPSRAPNFGGVINTRHNLTQSYLPNSGAGWMSLSRNDYGEVCVYCHTPHGAGINVALPLWNRTIRSTSYATYNQLGTPTLTQPVTQPGAASLSCLTCHDGQTAVDSIINMPGSGRARPGQATLQDTSFLDSWPGGPGSRFDGGHGTLSNTNEAFNNYGECQSCHSVNGPQHDPSGIPVFDAFYIGTDLRNDHPVGVKFPGAESGSDFNQPGASRPGLKWFDTNGNNVADKNELRLYDSGDGYEVECASCHDPHGVPSAGPSSRFNPTFLRVPNLGSAVCVTCHAK